MISRPSEGTSSPHALPVYTSDHIGSSRPRHVSLSQASFLIHRDHKTIKRACAVLGIPLARDVSNRFMLSAADVQRIADHISSLPAVIDSRGFARYQKAGSEENRRLNADLQQRIEAARQFKWECCGRYTVTEAVLDAVSPAGRGGAP